MKWKSERHPQHSKDAGMSQIKGARRLSAHDL
jgi:hypothetical protein